MKYTGPERRKHQRINARFMVSYRLLDEVNRVDATQTKNLCLGGMLLTTNKQFQPGTKLILEIRLPFYSNLVTIIAEVQESREITKDLIYDTRLSFLAIDEKHKSTINQTVDHYLKRIV